MTIHTHHSLVGGRPLTHDHDYNKDFHGHLDQGAFSYAGERGPFAEPLARSGRPLIPDDATEAAQINAENTANAKIIEDPVEHRVYHRSKVDFAGRPAGGWSHGTGFSIAWQDGPTQGVGAGRNGAFVEEVIEAAIVRLEFYQASAFHCVENAVALGHLQTALGVLRERTAGRRDRGVEGTHQL